MSVVYFHKGCTKRALQHCFEVTLVETEVVLKDNHFGNFCRQTIPKFEHFNPTNMPPPPIMIFEMSQEVLPPHLTLLIIFLSVHPPIKVLAKRNASLVSTVGKFSVEQETQKMVC